ncbi:hypothetical protein ABSA28_01108 [Candidatus Hepatincolaceae symbiont of Richtersius coronifer]
MEIKARVLLLKDSNQITTEAFNLVNQTIDFLKNKPNFFFDPGAEQGCNPRDIYVSFFMHYAKFLHRVLDNNQEEYSVSGILKDFSFNILTQATDMLNAINSQILPTIHISQAEADYLLLYLALIIQARKL